MKNTTSINKITKEFANKISILIEDNLSNKVDVDKIKVSNGKSKEGLECCKKGSFIYFLFNKNDDVIYIGESGQSVKNRLYTDGNGSHCQKDWFKEVEYVRYYNDKGMDDNTRKIIERALIMTYGEKYNLYNKDK